MGLIVVLAGLVLRVGARGQVSDSELSSVSELIAVKREIDRAYVRDVDTGLLDQASVNGMLQIATDRNSRYIPPQRREEFANDIEGRFVGIGVELDVYDEEPGLLVLLPIPGSPAEAAGIEPGDRIMAADGEDFTEIDDVDAVTRVQGPAGSTVSLTIERGNDTFDTTVVRAAVNSPVLRGFKRNPDGTPSFWITPPSEIADPTNQPKIGYILAEQFTSDLASKLREQILQLRDEGMDGFVLDLRQNPGGRLDMAEQILDDLLPGGVVVWVEGEHQPKRVVLANPDTKSLPTDMPMVVLVNGGSASASEVVAGALGDWGRATILGQQSYGKGSVQQEMTTPGGGVLLLTTAYYHLPSGRVIHRPQPTDDGGIDPNIVVPVDYRLAESQPSADAPFGPQQIWAAYEVLLAQLVEGTGETTVVPQLTPATKPTTQPNTQP